MAVRRNTIKREAGQALGKVIEPGDQIIAGTWAMTGPALWLDMLGLVPLLAFGIAGTTISASPGAWDVVPGLVPSLVPLVLLFWRRPVFVAVTQRQLICYRLSRMTNDPVRLWFSAPLLAVRVTSPGRPWPRLTSIRYDGPGAEGRSLRLNVNGRWRQDLDEVLAALHARGASVAGLPPAQAAVMDQSLTRYPAPPRSQRTNWLAVAALVCGVVQFLMVPAGIVAIILGHMARHQIRQTGENGRGLATAGLILGYTFIGLSIVLGPLSLGPLSL